MPDYNEDTPSPKRRKITAIPVPRFLDLDPNAPDFVPGPMAEDFRYGHLREYNPNVERNPNVSRNLFGNFQEILENPRPVAGLLENAGVHRRGFQGAYVAFALIPQTTHLDSSDEESIDE